MIENEHGAEFNLRPKLSPRKERVARIIAAGGTQKAAADELEVTKQTVNAWMKDEVMQSRIEQLRTDVFKQAEDLLIDSVVEAAETVRAIAIGKNSADSKLISSQLKAALYILDIAKRTKIPAIKQSARSNSIDAAIEGMDEEEVDEMLNRFEDDE